MSRATGTGYDYRKAAIGRLLGKLKKFVRRAVCRYDFGVVDNAEISENVCGGLHGLPVAL
jgi:hypothetical protein